MSILTYNSVSLPYAFATSFTQRPVREESQVDWYCTEFEIAVQTVLSLPYISIIAPNYTGAAITSAAELMNYVRQKLSQHRKRLSYIFNGVDLIPAPLGDGTVDADNGPKPQECECTLLTDNTFLVQFRIIARYWETTPSSTTRTLSGGSEPSYPGDDGGHELVTNPGGSPITNATISQEDPLATPNRTSHPVLYNRWTETVEIDNCEYTTRTREGKYRIRSDNVEGFQADQLRTQMAVVGCPAGFNRVSSKYTITPDGLGIQYTVVDREVFKHPPLPAFEAKGYYTETSTNNGAKRYGRVQLTLKGSRLTSQIALVEQGMKIASSKLRLRGATVAAKGGFKLLQHAQIKVGLYDNTVEVDLYVMMQPSGTGRKEGTTIADPGPGTFNLDYLTFTPLSDESSIPGLTAINPGPTYHDRGTANFLLQAAAYYDPNILNTELSSNGKDYTPESPVTPHNRSQMNNGKVPGTAGKSPE